MQLTKFNSILHQQHNKLSRYSGYFICKETRSSVQHFHKCSNILQVHYLQITKQSETIYIPHNVSLHEQTLDIVPPIPPTSPTLPYLTKSDLNKIHTDINQHHSDMKAMNEHISGMNDHISAMLEKLTDTSSNIDRQEKKPQSFHPNSQLINTICINLSSKKYYRHCHFSPTTNKMVKSQRFHQNSQLINTA